MRLTIEQQNPNTLEAVLRFEGGTAYCIQLTPPEIFDTTLLIKSINYINF